jgi:hypothetical protein
LADPVGIVLAPQERFGTVSMVKWDDEVPSLAASGHIPNPADFVDPVHSWVAGVVVVGLDVLYPLFQFFNAE